MEFGVIDYSVLTVGCALLGWGLVRGISGEVASLFWIVSLVLAGWFGHPVAVNVVSGFVRSEGIMADIVAIAMTIVSAFVVAGIVWRIVRKVVSLVVPQPWDALAGGISAVVKTLLLTAVLAGVGFVRAGEYSQTYLAERSVVVGNVATMLDMYLGK